MTRLVTLSPSVPATGLSLTEKVIDSVGGSIGCGCSGSTSSGGHGGWGTVIFSSPGSGADSAPPDAAEGENLRDPAGPDKIALAVEHFHRRVGPDRAGEHAAGDDAAEVGIGLEQRTEHAEAAGADLGRLDMLQHQVEQRRHILVWPVGGE